MNTTDTAGSVKDIFNEASLLFPNQLAELVYFEKYSRYRPELGRREVWPETVRRAVDYLIELSHNKLDSKVYDEIYDAILHFKVLPSMRLMAMAGPAARRSHITLYNCGYLTVDSLDAFVEALIISMSGTGLGYSVEKQYVNQLPIIKPQVGFPTYRMVVEDSAEGWAEALRKGLSFWFGGLDIEFDLSNLRPAGAILRTKGGRSSGPEPLRNMLNFARQRILSKQGQQLSTLDCHDIMGNIALGAVSGGHRRSAMIALYSWDDLEMRHCKDGDFWTQYPWRTTANNSAVIDGQTVSDSDLREHFKAMVAGGNGEPGIFSRNATRNMRPVRREDGDFGCNPCGEIGLNSEQFCNLSEVILTPEDDYYSILAKTRLATIIGTIQSMATNFPGLRPSWKKNCERERLLGVGFTGQMDANTDVWNQRTMVHVKEWAIRINKRYAYALGINESASITCVKPSGSTSLLTNASSGLHARWAPFYERNIRLMATGPVAKAYMANVAPCSPENGQTWDNYDTIVAHFPVKSPEGAITRGDRSAIEQCEYWKLLRLNLTEHNPSVTITYRPEEVQAVEDWIVENRGILGGMAFLPHFDEDITLKQMPNREIPEKEYLRQVQEFPYIDFSLITMFETDDETTSAMEPACSSGACSLE